MQSRILFRLRDGFAGTITELARELGSFRPSVSRSLTSLLLRLMVCRNGDSLVLTDEGREELRKIMETRFDDENLWRRVSLDELREWVREWDIEYLKGEYERLKGEKNIVEEELLRRAEEVLEG